MVGISKQNRRLKVDHEWRCTFFFRPHSCGKSSFVMHGKKSQSDSGVTDSSAYRKNPWFESVFLLLCTDICLKKHAANSAPEISVQPDSCRFYWCFSALGKAGAFAHSSTPGIPNMSLLKNPWARMPELMSILYLSEDLFGFGIARVPGNWHMLLHTSKSGSPFHYNLRSIYLPLDEGNRSWHLMNLILLHLPTAKTSSVRLERASNLATSPRNRGIPKKRVGIPNGKNPSMVSGSKALLAAFVS